MPTLNDLQSVALRGNLVGAYDPKYWVVGLADPVTQTELLTYILDNLGGGGAGIDDVTEGTVDPSGAPGVGEPAIYQNTSSGAIFVWDGAQWNAVAGGDDDITEGTGAPSGAPGAGNPQVYQNTVNGNLYVWNGSAWVLIGGGDNDITEGAGTPSGAPGAGEPQVYQDTTNGNVYTWDGSQWNIMAVVASNGLTKIGNDIELGGVLEKNTAIDLLNYEFQLQGFIPFSGSFMQTLFRMRPDDGAMDLYSRNDAASQEASLGILPNLFIAELNAASGNSEMSQDSTYWQALVSIIDKGTPQIVNRLLLNQNKTEILTNELQFKMESAQTGSVGHVLTLVDVVSGRAEWVAPSGDNDITEGSGNPSGNPGAGDPQVYQNTDNGSLWVFDPNSNTWFEVCLKVPLPIYDSIADAQAAGLTRNDQFKLSQNNTEGGIVGTVIEIV